MIDEATFHADVDYIESLWQRRPVGAIDMPIIDIGTGQPLVFVPILEHLEFVYARQVRAFSQSRRVILYRRQETRTRPVGLPERAEELRHVLDSLGLEQVDFVGHGDAAMVLFEFAVRYPQRCRSLVIIAQGADYQIAPHPFIWFLHELYARLPVEHFLPAWFLRRTVINYITAKRNVVIEGIPLPDTFSLSGVSRGSSPLTGCGVSPLFSFPLARRLRRRAKKEEVRTPHTSAEGGSPLHSQNVSGRELEGGRQSPQPRTLPRALIEEQFRKIAQWPFVYKFSVIPVIHSYDMRKRLDSLTMPILLINRADDVLSPEPKTRWLAAHLPNCAGYHVILGGERFFMYSEAEKVNSLIEQFLAVL